MEGPELLVALSLSAKKLIRKIPHTIAVIPYALAVGFGRAWTVSRSLPRISACTNREWFPLSLAPKPGPVNQVHKPKLLGEVVLLNSSQLLEFFFPLSLLIGESWVFPGSWFARERKREQEIIAQEERSFEEVFCDFTAYPPLLFSLFALHVLPSQNVFVPLTNSALRSSKVEYSACLALAQRYKNTPSDILSF